MLILNDFCIEGNTLIHDTRTDSSFVLENGQVCDYIFKNMGYPTRLKCADEIAIIQNRQELDSYKTIVLSRLNGVFNRYVLMTHINDRWLITMCTNGVTLISGNLVCILGRVYYTDKNISSSMLIYYDKAVCPGHRYVEVNGKRYYLGVRLFTFSEGSIDTYWGNEMDSSIFSNKAEDLVRGYFGDVESEELGLYVCDRDYNMKTKEMIKYMPSNVKKLILLNK